MTGIKRRQFVTGTGIAVGGAMVPPLLGGTGRAAAAVTGSAAAGRAPSRSQRARTLFGTGYETWFTAGVNTFGSAEAQPVLGRYSSYDPRVAARHAKWLTDAGFDFILVDWSNNLGGNWTNGVAQKIIKGTQVLLDVYTRLPRHPKVALLVGQDNGQVGTSHFAQQLDYIQRNYLDDPRYRPLFLDHDGKPLLVIYRDGPIFVPPPDFTDPRFTIRWMSAYHESTLNPGGDWSWLDRAPLVAGPRTPVSQFASKGLAGWTADPAWHLVTGQPVPGLPDDVRPAYVTTQSSDNLDTGTITSPPFTVTEEVITFNAAGVDVLESSKSGFGAGQRDLFYLKDAAAGTVLRTAEPPNNSMFQPMQWNVADLAGRTVVFQAVKQNTTTGFFNPGWLAFFGLAQVRNESLCAPVAVGGRLDPVQVGQHETLASYAIWDAQPRRSGATLVRFMQGAYDHSPEIVFIQQWNEFAAPDEVSVEGSNDIEPTTVTTLAGSHSDGWGFYYLDLVKELIRQYRSGAAFPAVRLDTRYP